MRRPKNLNPGRADEQTHSVLGASVSVKLRQGFRLGHPRAPPRIGAILTAAFVLAWGGPDLGAADPETTQTTQSLKQLSLEELMQVEIPTVRGASKFEQKTTEAPSLVTVISADEIKRYGYRTLADALRGQQGFYVSYDRNYAFLGARGVNLGDFNSRMLLLVDGHRVNNNLSDGAYIDTAFILDVDLIDRVELIRGPGSVLYGNNAFFGVINVVTRTGKQVNGAEVSGTYASFDSYKGRLTVGKSFTNGVEFLLSGSYLHSEGPDRLYFEEFDTPEQNNGVATDRDDDASGSVFGTLSYEDFTLQGAFNSREKGNPTAQHFTTFNDPRLRTVDDRSYVDLRFTHAFPADVDVIARAYYDQTEYEIGYPFGSPVASALYEEVQTGQWWGLELQLNKRVFDRHTLSVGAEFRDDFHQDQRVFDQTTTYKDVHKDRQSFGVFAQGDFQVLTNLHFNGGLRYDQYGDFDPSFSPRLALIYHPYQSSTLKILYGTAFRAPNFQELSDPRFQNIEPEQIKSLELVYEQGLGQHLRSSLSGFRNVMDDLIDFRSGSYANLDAETRGMELALEGSWPKGVRGRASYTFQKTEDCSTGRDFSDSPEHLFKLNLSVPVFRDKIFAGLEYQYIGSRHTFYTTSVGTTLPGEDTSGFGVLNFTLFSQDLVKNLEFSASVYNLLDTSYADPATRLHLQDQIPQDGRTFRIKMTYRF
jgi:outer membrane receptor for ferrienterochelin and colicins